MPLLITMTMQPQTLTTTIHNVTAARGCCVHRVSLVWIALLWHVNIFLFRSWAITICAQLRLHCIVVSYLKEDCGYGNQCKLLVFLSIWRHLPVTQRLKNEKSISSYCYVKIQSVLRLWNIRSPASFCGPIKEGCLRNLNLHHSYILFHWEWFPVQWLEPLQDFNQLAISFAN